MVPAIGYGMRTVSEGTGLSNTNSKFTFAFLITNEQIETLIFVFLIRLFWSFDNKSDSLNTISSKHNDVMDYRTLHT